MVVDHAEVRVQLGELLGKLLHCLYNINRWGRAGAGLCSIGRQADDAWLTCKDCTMDASLVASRFAASATACGGQLR